MAAASCPGLPHRAPRIAHRPRTSPPPGAHRSQAEPEIVGRVERGRTGAHAGQGSECAVAAGCRGGAGQSTLVHPAAKHAAALQCAAGSQPAAGMSPLTRRPQQIHSATAHGGNHAGAARQGQVSAAATAAYGPASAAALCRGQVARHGAAVLVHKPCHPCGTEEQVARCMHAWRAACLAGGQRLCWAGRRGARTRRNPAQHSPRSLTATARAGPASGTARHVLAWVS